MFLSWTQVPLKTVYNGQSFRDALACYLEQTRTCKSDSSAQEKASVHCKNQRKSPTNRDVPNPALHLLGQGPIQTREHTVRIVLLLQIDASDEHPEELHQCAMKVSNIASFPGESQTYLRHSLPEFSLEGLCQRPDLLLHRLLDLLHPL